ncbi:hypothetical protein AB0I61_09690 [Polymorphospora rubra]|uniref:hypothetical protein n=1 Tax=Polymorphospora rubra TaxID=338584 RepID=UPI00340C9159
MLLPQSSSPAALNPARQAIKKLVLPKQRRIHFHKEKDARRWTILNAIIGLGAEVIIYDAAGQRSIKAARDACLTQLVADLAKINAARLVLERDDSTIQSDQQLLYREVRTAGMADEFRYDLMRAHEEVLLAIPDAVAWCWAKGGRWRLAAEQVVMEKRHV